MKAATSITTAPKQTAHSTQAELERPLVLMMKAFWIIGAWLWADAYAGSWRNCSMSADGRRQVLVAAFAYVHEGFHVPDVGSL